MVDTVQHLIHSFHHRPERTVSKFVPDTKLGEEESIHVLEGRAAIQTNNLQHGLTSLACFCKGSTPGTQ